MRISNKVVLIAVVSVALYTTLDLVTQLLVIQPSFEELEQVDAQRNMQRCIQAINREIHHLDLFCFDWAAWDDTYAYVVSPNKAYEASNLVPSTYLDNELNVLYIVNQSGAVVWGRYYNLATESVEPFPDLPQQMWGQGHPLLQFSGEEDYNAGIMLTNKGLLLVAARPVLTSETKGPIRGAVIMGRLLTEERLELLQEQTQVVLSVAPAAPALLASMSTVALYGGSSVDGGATIEAEPAPGYPISPKPQRYRYDFSHPDKLAVSVLLPDVFGNPAFLLEVRLPRTITKKGAMATRVATIWAVISSLVCLFTLLFLMRRLVTTPLSQLTYHVASIESSAQLAPVVMAERDDELGNLSLAFNRMVRRLSEDAENRSAAEAALRESEAQFQALLNAIGDAVWSRSLDGCRMYYSNHAVKEIFGWSGQDFDQDPALWEKVLYEDDKPCLADLNELVQKRSQGDAEYRIVHRDTEIRWVHERRTLIRAQEESSSRVVCVIRDITQLKRMHERMAETQHLAELGELGASMAHEIRNPLTGISAALSVIEVDLPKGDRQRSLITEALNSVDRVEHTVQRILTYARPWEPRKVRGDIRAFACNCCQRLTSQDPWKTIVVDIEEGDPLYVDFDGDLLEDVCHNLILNALQAQGEAKAVEIAFQEEPDQVLVLLRDNGPGFAPETLPYVFKAFFTTKTRGSGLGLPICRRIIEAHGGHIVARNRAEGGAEIELSFPRENESADPV